MVTNVFTPHVGGVARSVQGFTDEFRRRGHRVVVVAPLFEGAAEHETDVVRFPAIQHYSPGDFSIPVPVPGRLSVVLHDFHPDVVHSHHPFLLGDTALRIAATHGIPIVFTHHTLYEQYTHYVPGDSPRLKGFVIDLVTGYCNLCDAVVAPSQSIGDLLRTRGVTVPVAVIPTGIDVATFSSGDGAGFRRRMGIPENSFVVGHVGRLAAEKNLSFLGEAVATFLVRHPRARFLLAGEGESKPEIQGLFADRGLADRLHVAGHLGPSELAAAYKSMNVFAFASQSETQGLVLVEAMAAGVPVVAVDATGVREVLRDRINGRMLSHENRDEFVDALAWIASLNETSLAELRMEIANTATAFSMSSTAETTLSLYHRLIVAGRQHKPTDGSLWETARRRIKEDWKILRNIAHAAGTAVRPHRKSP
ncbi:MAG: glycosyltransferase [Planctomycetaceae bacterium]